MSIKFSDFGTKLTSESGILTLMDDLGKPLPPHITESFQLGGGNPAQIPEVAAMYRKEMERILSDGDSFENLIGRYDAPQGRMEFLETVAEYLSKTYGWNITAENVAVSNGSQSACFYLFNLFSGTFTEKGKSKKKKILLPLVPEYIGYADQGIEEGTFVSIPSKFEIYDDNTFKYFVDFDLLEDYLKKHDDIGAMCVSRPTNPTGNVLTDNEIQKLSELAASYGFPLIVDNAYGVPWPNIIFMDNATPFWNENVILSMSLSKIGLPSLRTGIIVARKEIITALGNMNAIAALASGSVGQAVASPLIKSGKLVETAGKIVRPFYEKKSLQTIEWIKKYFGEIKGDFSVHKSEGAIFQWLLMNDLKITTKEFYGILKNRGVIVVPGEYFFFGNSDDNSLPEFENHPHYSKCLRLNYSRPAEEVERGIQIIAEEYSKYRM